MRAEINAFHATSTHHFLALTCGHQVGMQVIVWYFLIKNVLK
jgi:hypothetical protein